MFQHIRTVYRYLKQDVPMNRLTVYLLFTATLINIYNATRQNESEFKGFNPAESSNILAIADEGKNLADSLKEMSPTAYQAILKELHSDKGLGPYNNVISALLNLEENKDKKVPVELIRAGINGVKSLKAEKAQALPTGWADCVEYSDSMSFILNQLEIKNFEIDGHVLNRNAIKSGLSNHRFLGIIDKKGKFYILECTSTGIDCLKESKITYEEFKNGKPAIFDHYKVSYYGYGTDLARLKEELGKFPKINFDELPRDKKAEILSLYQADLRSNPPPPYIDNFGSASSVDKIVPSPNIERIDPETGQRVRRAHIVNDGPAPSY